MNSDIRKGSKVRSILRPGAVGTVSFVDLKTNAADVDWNDGSTQLCEPTDLVLTVQFTEADMARMRQAAVKYGLDEDEFISLVAYYRKPLAMYYDRLTDALKAAVNDIDAQKLAADC